LVASAVEWLWSSAAAHVTGTDSTGLVDWAEWQARWEARSW